ncbi:MAG: hypothetical protein WBB65_04600 [Anaerolineales bacterium]
MNLNLSSELLEYLAAHTSKPGRYYQTLAELTNEFDLRIHKQLEVSCVMEFVGFDQGRGDTPCDAAQKM